MIVNISHFSQHLVSRIPFSMLSSIFLCIVITFFFPPLVLRSDSLYVTSLPFSFVLFWVGGGSLFGMNQLVDPISLHVSQLVSQNR